jgi:sarcosine oxidase subunit beta
MANTADIAVIGGGIIGTSCAYELARRGAGKIVLFEKEGPAAGTSGRSAGVICRVDLGPIYVRLTLLGFRRIAEFRREHGFAFAPWGGLGVVWEPAAFPPDDRLYDLYRTGSEGLYVREVLARDELLARFPWIRPEGVRGGIFEPNVGFIDPYELIALYRRLLSTMPAVELSYNNPVLQVRRQGDRITELATRRGLWRVGMVLNAGGPWGAGLAASAGTSLRLTPQRVQVCVATAYDDGDYQAPLTGVPNAIVDGDGVWCRGELGGGMLFGQHHHTTRADLPTADPDHFNRGNDSGYPAAVEAIYRRYYRLPKSTFLSGWSCVYGTTEDGYPIISRDGHVWNLYHAVGMNGHGMTIHAGVARCVTQIMLDDDPLVDVSDVMPWPATIDVSRLDAGRFERGELLRLDEVEDAPGAVSRSIDREGAAPWQ